MTPLPDALSIHSRHTPDRTAISEFDGTGWIDTSWAQLHDMARRAAGHTRALEPGPVILVLDNSASGIAILFGLMLAGRDTICVERDNSHLADERSILRRVRTAATITPESYPAVLSSAPGDATEADPAVYQLTSGSTGEPRIARQTLSTVTKGGEIYRDWLGYDSTDHVLLPIPAAHSFGLVGGVASAVLAGARLLTLNTFSLSAIHHAISQGASIMLGTPLVYRLLTSAPPTARGALRLLLSSGGPLDLPANQLLGIPISQVYGSTETGLIAAQVPGREWPAESVGVAAPGVSLRTGTTLSVRTATQFTGYLRPSGIEPASGDWYDTGDAARIEDGVLYVTGRKETFVNVGGRKVNPERVRRLVIGHPAVRDAYVFGVQTGSGEQAVHAAVVADESTVAEDIVEFCRTRLRPYELPHRVHLVGQLPRSALGKVDRTRLLAGLPGDEPLRATKVRTGVSAEQNTDPGYVAVIGLGYIGLPLAASLAATGLRVVGVDTSPDVRAAIQAGRPLFHEPGLEELLARLSDEDFTVTDRLPAGDPRAIIVCVGTAADAESKQPDLRHLESAVDHLAPHVTEGCLVIIRSTIPVGTCRRTVLPRLAEQVAAPLLAFCPERTIQGTALAELRSLPQVIGGLDGASAEAARKLLSPLAPDQVIVSSLEAAEMVKLVNNAHTDLIYGFGNEVALLAERFGVDAREVIDGANIRYPRPDLSRPGFVGGSCLVKDPYLLLHAGQQAGYHAPMVAAARAVNESVPHRAVDRVLAALAAQGRELADAKVLVCGIAYKGRPETDDVRGSAASTVHARLRDRVGQLAGHDFVVGTENIAAMGFHPVDLTDGLKDADAVFVLTDHPDYGRLDGPDLLATTAARPVVFDMWGVLETQLAGLDTVTYLRLGRG